VQVLVILSTRGWFWRDGSKTTWDALLDVATIDVHTAILRRVQWISCRQYMAQAGVLHAQEDQALVTAVKRGVYEG
jgi:hypothetical protein